MERKCRVRFETFYMIDGKEVLRHSRVIGEVSSAEYHDLVRQIEAIVRIRMGIPLFDLEIYMPLIGVRLNEHFFEYLETHTQNELHVTIRPRAPDHHSEPHAEILQCLLARVRALEHVAH